MRQLIPIALLLGWLVPAAGLAGGPFPGGRERSAWSLSLATGYDTYVQTYPLATQDTTETISELTLVLGAAGRTPGRARHCWLLNPEVSLGSQLTRERLDLGYQWRPDSLHAVLRLDAGWQGRQYRPGTDYSFSSDTGEGRATARWYLAPAGRSGGETRLWARRLRYERPSTLEVNYDELGGGLFWRSGPLAPHRWLLGSRLARRTYPDSMAIDRTVIACEGEYDSFALEGSSVRLFHRSERRLIRQEEIRPSAWDHLSELEAALALDRGWLTLDLQSEVWDYDVESLAYFDSWRLGGVLGYRGGDPLAWTWRLGLAVEALLAGPDSPETYLQAGLRGGLETYGSQLSGSLTVEYGHRDYRQPAVGAVDTASLVPDEDIYGYSDFQYWELWLMATWLVSGRFSCDVMANYQPESHTERTDDTAVAFASLRFVWRR